MGDKSQPNSDQKGGSDIRWTEADEALRAYYDENFNPVDSQCCSCHEATLEVLECNHFLCNKCSVEWREACFSRRPGADFTCPMCRDVIIKYVPVEVEEGEEEEEYDPIVILTYEGESFQYDRRTGLQLVERQFPNLHYAIAVLFFLAEVGRDMSKLEVMFRQFIMADELDDVIYRVFIILFDRYDERGEPAISWLCTHVRFDIYKELGHWWDDESVITLIMGYGMFDLARRLFQDGVASVNRNSGENSLINHPLERRDYDMVRFMVAHGLDLNQVYRDISPLQDLYIHDAPVEILQLFIDNGVDMNRLNEANECLLLDLVVDCNDDRVRAREERWNLKKSYIRTLLSNGCNDIQISTDPETLEVVYKDVFESLEEGTFTREEWEAMKPSSVMRLRSGKVVIKRKRGE